MDSDSLDDVVCCTGLTKRYGDFAALVDCTFSVQRGDVFGLLGPNGAGKTTLIRSLLGYLATSDGHAKVCGGDPAVDPVQVRQRVSYLPGDARLPRHMRGEGVLRFFAELHPLGDLKRSLEIADALELDTRRQVGLMSTGMRQKLALAVVLAPRTPLLILDEPTANLDPSVRARVLEFVLEANRDGRTVMFSSHVLSEIEETCNRVAFLKKGRLVHQLKMAELFQRHRVWGDCAVKGERATLQIPDDFRDQVKIAAVQKNAAKRDSNSDDMTSWRIDTSGDLAPLLNWLATLNLSRMRIEPLGLRAIYDAVHVDQVEDPRDRIHQDVHEESGQGGDQDAEQGRDQGAGQGRTGVVEAVQQILPDRKSFDESNDSVEQRS